jgi:hypothetical protein
MDGRKPNGLELRAVLPHNAIHDRTGTEADKAKHMATTITYEF